MFEWLLKKDQNEAKKAKKGQKVLVLGGTEEFTFLLSDHAEEHGYYYRFTRQPEKVCNIWEAHHKYEEPLPDFILIDLHLPYNTTYKTTLPVIAFLKAHLITTNIPIIGFSNKPKITDIELYEEADCQGFIDVSQSRPEIYDILNSALEGQWGDLKKHPFDHLTPEEVKFRVEKEIGSQKTTDISLKLPRHGSKLNNEQLEIVRDLWMEDKSARAISEITGFLDRNGIIMEIHRMNLDDTARVRTRVPKKRINSSVDN